MPGLFGIARHSRYSPQAPQASEGLGAAFDRLVARDASGSGALRFESSLDPQGRWAIGRSHHGVLQPAPQLTPNDARHTTQVLFHGDLQNGRDLARNGSLGVPEGSSAAEILKALYARDGARAAAHLQGSHCAVIVDDRAQTLTLVNDRLGSYPLYWSASPRGLVFGSELRAVLRSGEAPRELDAAAVADCLTFGFPVGTKTLARGVHLLPPGSTLTYGWQSGDVAISRYAHQADSFTSGVTSGTKEAFLEELAGVFRAAVERAFDGSHAFGLALSGGLDSRAILSAVNGRASTLTTYTLGVDGCADQVIAERLSSLTGTRHRFFELDKRYIGDFLPNLERMVWLTDGMFLSHGLTEILALGLLNQTGVEVLLRGHGGELAKTSTAWPFHTDDRIHAMRDRRELVPYLIERMNYISRGVDLASLFTPEWSGEVKGSPRRSLEDAVQDVGLSPSDTCTYLYITEHSRRSSIPSLELFREAVEVRMPFFDPAFMALLLQAPASWRHGVEIHRVLTEKNNRQLLRVRNSNTGAPAGAGPLVEMALDKVNTVLRRLNVYGYRHYHQFDAWMRAELVSQVEAVLLDRRTVERGVFREATVRRLVDDTKSGVADRSFLLLVLLIIELWQRQNLS